ncbi:hypothetical protein B7486_68375, partial [cyanobacterium TDX16]
MDGAPTSDRVPTDGSPHDALPSVAWAVALSLLPEMGPARLLAVLRRWSPEDAWAQVLAGTVADAPAVAQACVGAKGDPVPGWQRAARTCDVGEVWDRHAAADLHVGWRGDGGIPAPLAEDVEPPAVLFRRGSLDVLDGPRVAIVGTRRC